MCSTQNLLGYYTPLFEQVRQIRIKNLLMRVCRFGSASLSLQQYGIHSHLGKISSRIVRVHSHLGKIPSRMVRVHSRIAALQGLPVEIWSRVVGTDLLYPDLDTK